MDDLCYAIAWDDFCYAITYSTFRRSRRSFATFYWRYYVHISAILLDYSETDGISARWEGWRQTIKLLAIGKGSNCRPEPSFVGADRQIERSRSLFHVERRWRISHFWSEWSYEKHSFRDTSQKSTVWLTNRNRRTVYDQVKTKPLNLETLPLWMSKFVNKSVCRMNSAKEHWRDITFCVEESEKKAHSQSGEVCGEVNNNE